MGDDLLIKNGRIIDGSGNPAYRGDIAVQHGKIVEMGKCFWKMASTPAIYRVGWGGTRATMLRLPPKQRLRRTA